MTQEDPHDELRRWALGSGCRLCVLFGSTAAGGPGWKGDVDVAASFAELPEPTARLELIGRLQEGLAREDVDLVFLHDRTEPVLRFEIFRTGTPVFEEEEGLFVREKVRALMLYQDALPFRRARREKLRRVAAEGHRVP